jgi:hypothetical protein
MFIGVDDMKSADDLKKPLFDLEFGRELAYFQAKHAISNSGPVLQGKPTTAYTVTIEDWQLFLFTAGTPKRPVAVSRVRGSNRDTYWYGAYEELPFDPKLFMKPEGITIHEAKQ